MTDHTTLSPAAQAVVEAYASFSWQPGETHHSKRIAGVLRAAADQIAPVENELIDDCWYEKQNLIRDQLLAIATELENHQ